MSRIDSALEKAAMLREGIKEKNHRVTHRPPTPIRPPPTLDKVKITDPLLVSANDPHNSIAEEYRKLKSIMVKLTKKEEGFQNTVMVTSCLCSEGKSVTALNLAISLAQDYDHTVLLVDADLRKPSLHKYFALEPSVGLSECITGGIDLSKALIDTGIGKLSLLPGGTILKNPVELFSSQKVRELFLDIKNRYPDRYIIIDTPSVLPFTDSRTLSTIVDGVLLVVKEGVPSPHDITEALGYLKGPALLGIVYNEAHI